MASFTGDLFPDEGKAATVKFQDDGYNWPIRIEFFVNKNRALLTFLTMQDAEDLERKLVKVRKANTAVECSECAGDGYLNTVTGEMLPGLGGIEPIVSTTKCDRCQGTGKELCANCGAEPAFRSHHSSDILCRECQKELEDDGDS